MADLNFVSYDSINKGWSSDKKYCVTDIHGTRYLLRISPPDQFSKKESEFKMMQQIYLLGVPMCRPIEFGTCKGGVYSIQSWIEGKDAEDVIPTLSDAKIYMYGLEAGRILRLIHSIPAPIGWQDWETRFNKKIDRNIKDYANCPIKHDAGHIFVEYIDSHRGLLKNRPQVYQHGDYHIGNMMIDNMGQLNIIDFDRNDYGDPWEEFNRIVWSVQISPIFASGIVNGYFDGNVPMMFWKLLALYISSNALSSLPWAIPFGQSEIDVMLNQAKQVLEWYDYMQSPIPTWYLDPSR